MKGSDRGFIGLITDFGDGPYQGIMKAVIKSLSPDLDVIDIDHWVPSFNVIAGAYIVLNSYYWMPKGSVITVVVDPGVGSSRKAIAVETTNYYFVGPDNGVLYPAIARDGFERAVVLSAERVHRLALERARFSLPGSTWPLSNTFHGRDLFAPAAALIASGAADLEDLGSRIDYGQLKRVTLDHVERVNGGFRAVVLYIDKFGNVALSIKKQKIDLAKWRKMIITTPRGASFQAKIASTFSDVAVDDMVVYPNSFGYLEIAVNRGNAAKRMRVEIGDKLALNPIP